MLSELAETASVGDGAGSGDRRIEFEKWSHMAEVYPQKKGAPNQGRSRTPAKGLTERHPADAPLRGRGQGTTSVRYKDPKAQVGGFREAVT